MLLRFTTVSICDVNQLERKFQILSMTRNDDDEFHSFSFLSHQINSISAMSAEALTMNGHDAGHLRSSLQSANKSAPAAVNCVSQGGMPNVPIGQGFK